MAATSWRWDSRTICRSAPRSTACRSSRSYGRGGSPPSREISHIQPDRFQRSRVLWHPCRIMNFRPVPFPSTNGGFVMRRTQLFPLIVASLLLLAAAPPSKSPSVREDVQGFVRAFVDASNRADVTAVMEMYSQKAGIASIGDGEITRGWDAIRTESDEIVGKEGAY